METVGRDNAQAHQSSDGTVTGFTAGNKIISELPGFSILILNIHLSEIYQCNYKKYRRLPRIPEET
jgi:hypothetical protein